VPFIPSAKGGKYRYIGNGPCPKVKFLMMRIGFFLVYFQSSLVSFHRKHAFARDKKMEREENE
jgi:hypothetical protein